MSNPSVKQAVDDFRTRSQGQVVLVLQAGEALSGCVSSVARGRGGHDWIIGPRLAPSAPASSPATTIGTSSLSNSGKMEWETAAGFLDLCFDAKKATETTLQPIRRFGFDAAILLSDILVVSPRIALSSRHGPSLPTYGRAHLAAFPYSSNSTHKPSGPQIYR